MVCIGMGIKILQQGEARRRSIAISYATDEERRLAAKDNLAPYKLFQHKVFYIGDSFAVKSRPLSKHQ